MEGMLVEAAHPGSFGALLRQHRLDAGLTQAGLAERAGISLRALQYLERSGGQPQRETTRRLAEALALTAEHRILFERAGAPAPRTRARATRPGPSVIRIGDSLISDVGDGPAPWRDLGGEYKRVTILVAEVAGLTESVQDFEPDTADRLLAEVTPVLVDLVRQHEGTVSLAGNGVMAHFGAPVAHEDDAVRACITALSMHEAFDRYARRVAEERGIRVALRVGLDSGEVVIRSVSNDLSREYMRLGPAVRVATQLGQLARNGTTLLTQETLRLAEGYVRVRPIGPISTVELSEPVAAFELAGPEPARTRFERVVRTRQLTRFVGRGAELEALYDSLARARASHGEVVALVGDPGVGKSRLIWELTRFHRTEGWLVLESGSDSYNTSASYHPVIDLLKAYCRIKARDDELAVRKKVFNKLATLDESLRPTLPALLALLDVPPGDAAWDALDSTQRRRKTLDGLKRLILCESRERLLLLVIEDLQWIDAETQALLDTLVDSLPTARILLVVTYRPEFSHGWGSKTFYSQVRVARLEQESANALLTGLVGDDASLGPLKALLTERTECNPLFLEECVRALIETGLLVGERGAYHLARPVRDVRVPATVQAVLAARIDRLLPEQKRLIQTAAVIGKDVPFALLCAVAERSEGEIQRELAALQAAELLYEASLFPELEYTFRHALTQEVTYRSLLQERRRELHAQVVRGIERLYPNRLAEHLERLAHHAVRAELWEPAADYSHQAGNRARTLSAYRAAADHLEHALTALKHVPATRERTEQAIDIRLGLRSALRLLGEHGQIPDLLREAEVLAEGLGDQRRLAWATYFLSNFYFHDGQHERAIEACRRVAAAANALNDPQLKVVGCVGVALPRACLGQYRQAANGFLRSVATLSTEQLGERPAESTGSDGIISLANVAWCLAELGAFDEGKVYEEQAIRLAEDAGHAYALLVVLDRSSMLALRQGDTSRLIPRLERAVDLVHTQDLPNLAAQTQARLGAAYMQAGRLEDALPLLERTAQLVNAGQAGAERVFFVASVAEGYLRRGHLDAASDMTNRALTMARERRERGNEAWVLRLLAEIAAHRDPPDSQAAATRYQDALALAEELEMRPLQAHCHLGLGKLYRRVGRLAEARAELSAAIAMLRDMGMTCWLPESEAELAKTR